MEKIALGDNEVICQKWEESERGWGRRPDGFSLHISYEALQCYLESYRSQLPDYVPDEYSMPDGTPYPVGVAEDVLDLVSKNDGVRFFGTPPGSEGIDGWITIR